MELWRRTSLLPFGSGGTSNTAGLLALSLEWRKQHGYLDCGSVPVASCGLAASRKESAMSESNANGPAGERGKPSPMEANKQADLKRSAKAYGGKSGSCKPNASARKQSWPKSRPSAIS